MQHQTNGGDKLEIMKNLKSENVNIENKGASGKNFWNFEIFNLKWENWHLTSPKKMHYPPPPSPHSTIPLKSKIYWLLLKSQNSNSPTNLSRRCTLCLLCQCGFNNPYRPHLRSDSFISEPQVEHMSGQKIPVMQNNFTFH